MSTTTRSRRPYTPKPGTDTRDAWQRMTDMVLTQLQHGVVPWHKKWREVDRSLAHNGFTGRPYRGINLVSLMLDTQFEDKRWLTPRQAKELGGRVRDDEWDHFRTIVFWKHTKWKKTDDNGDEQDKQGIFLRYTRAYNVEQCEGLRLKPVPPAPEAKGDNHEVYAQLEAWWAALTDRPMRLRHGGAEAYYEPLEDLISLPHDYAFETKDDYWATRLHELGHSTGHPKRLARKEIVMGGRRTKQDRSSEELTAEFTAWFLGLHFGINIDGDNSAAYIAGWVEKIGSEPREVVYSVTRAQRAVDFLFKQAEPQEDDDED